jgi:hypothetical protein
MADPVVDVFIGWILVLKVRESVVVSLPPVGVENATTNALK